MADKGEKKEKKEGAFFKMKKNIAGKAATSGIGKAVLKKVLDDNTNKLMGSLKKVIEIHVDKKKSEEIQNNLIKILLKAQFQIEKKNIAPEEFMAVDKPLRKAFRRLVKLNDPQCEKNPQERIEAFEKVERNIKKVGKIAGTQLGSFMTHKNKLKLTETINFLANPEFLNGVWSNPKCKAQREILCETMKNFAPPKINLDEVAE
eukprot:TRINITY_DN8926_c0_g1_i1.p1 TRINITY_DN8926_c0_g1~~TRINITY_DN8926_c0_g1_i1.p1  ORF type:complete len:204 (-),score=66.01 TRINITY_DN8926_c0_g1_i1:138-749(-)